MQQSLFQGPFSLRDPAERVAFWLTAVCALPAALLIGYVLHESIGASQVALFIVIAMVYVTLARGRLLGSSVRVHDTQYPRVFAIVKRACAALDIPMPLVFVREDNYVPVAALGFGEPYALVLSSHWIEVFRDDELAFMIGRELGHIAAGHTRFLSLLSVNGKENPLISLIFGGWLRRCTMTCDKVGLLCCGSLDAAIRAIGVAEFHEFGRKVDYQAFAEQHAEIQADSVSRWGTWLGSEPYATTRIAALRAFIETPAYAAGSEWFMRERGEEPPALSAPGTGAVDSRDCAGWWRRFAATAIDVVVVLAIINSFTNGSSGTNAPSPIQIQESTPSPSAAPETKPSPRYHWRNPLAGAPESRPVTSSRPNTAASASANAGSDDVDLGPVTIVTSGATPVFQIGGLKITSKIVNPNNSTGKTFWFAIYMALLVTLAGQTFGMMIAGLRVVTVDFRRPSVWRSAARYLLAMVLWPLIVALSFFWRRVLLHDRWTKTRLVKVERVVARMTGTN